MNKPKVLYTDVHKWLDVGCDEVPNELLDKLERCIIYRDQALKEHMYNLMDIFDGDNENEISEEWKEELTAEDIEFIKELIELLTKHDAAYVRFVFS